MMLNGFMAKRKTLSGRPARAVSSRKNAGRGRKDRKKDGAVWIYGVHAVLAAISNPRRNCRRIVAASPQSAQGLESRLAEAAQSCGAERPRLEIRDRRELGSLLPRDAVHQGAAALCDPLPETALEDVLEDARDNAPNAAQAAVVVLDQATDPRNVGAVLRSAAAFGALAVIVQDRHAPQATPALAKAAAGALEITPLVRVPNVSRALKTLKDHGFWCAGLDARAVETLAGADLSGKVALVLGAEGAGLRRLTSESCDLLVRAPISGAVESLNLSNAAAIALYELRRNT